MPRAARIQPLWKLQTMGLAVPSPVGPERVRVRGERCIFTHTLAAGINTALDLCDPP